MIPVSPKTDLEYNPYLRHCIVNNKICTRSYIFSPWSVILATGNLRYPEKNLHNICRIRKFLTQEITEKLIHAFVTSRLDYCNSLLYGLPSNLLAKLQRVQNAAARLIHRAPRFCHITPLLVDLHWLDIKSRIDFKTVQLNSRYRNECYYYYYYYYDDDDTIGAV